VNPRNDTLEQLAGYLGHYAMEYFQATSIECDLTLPQSLPHQPVSSEARHNLFLAFEEALNNVLKHSLATRVRIEMRFLAPQFEIQVTDNGRGFKTPAPSAAPSAPPNPHGGRSGSGLKNMPQRLADVGGECLIKSPATGEGGTAVTLRIHLDRTKAITP
jgi:signal transduction histidine kinase